MILNAIVASSASDQVKHLIEKMEYKVNENMSLWDLSHRATFQKIFKSSIGG